MPQKHFNLIFQYIFLYILMFVHFGRTHAHDFGVFVPGRCVDDCLPLVSRTCEHQGVRVCPINSLDSNVVPKSYYRGARSVHDVSNPFTSQFHDLFVCSFHMSTKL